MNNNKITLKNDFHGTECVVIVHADNAPEAWFEIQYAADDDRRRGAPSRRRLARVRATLCGSADCQCGVVR